MFILVHPGNYKLLNDVNRKSLKSLTWNFHLRLLTLQDLSEAQITLHIYVFYLIMMVELNLYLCENGNAF